MDVYVESNFVVELALLQEQHESCERILALCESGEVKLILPAYSLVEPQETLVRYGKRRKKLSTDLGYEVTQSLSRSKPYKDEVEEIHRLTAFLIRSQQEEKDRLLTTLDRLLNITEVIPLESTILSLAAKYQFDHDLRLQDSIVLASVLNHLRTSTSSSKCFLNKDRKDFGDPDIVDALDECGCKILFRFDDGFNYITSQLRT